MSITPSDLIEFFERGDIDRLKELGGVESLASAFETDLQTGLSLSESDSNFTARKQRWGENVLPDPPVKSWCSFFMDTLRDLMVKILVVISLVSIILNAIFSHDQGFLHFIDPIAILVSALICSAVAAQVNWVQQKAFLTVSRLKNEFTVNVIRAGQETQILSTELLVGDLLRLKSGDAIPIDGIYLSGHAFMVNNSQTTGESAPVKVDEDNPVVLSGTVVDSGEATVLVCAVGRNSQNGVVMEKLQKMGAQRTRTPLEKRLDRVALLITYVGLVGAVMTFTVLFILWLVDIIGTKWQKKYLTDLIDRLMVTFTMFIGAVPEGLPVAVVISLGFSMKKMMKDNNFVRHMSACETMGGATTICSDKTGTLTQNRMTVVVYHMDGIDYDGHPALPKSVMDTLASSIAVNTNAGMVIKEGQSQPEYVGKSTECALLKFIGDSGYDYKEIRDSHPTVVLHDFNSTRKRMSSVVKWGDSHRIMMKGAPEVVIGMCSKYMTASGDVRSLTESVRTALLEKVDELAESQLRTMLIAYGDLPSHDFNEEWNDPLVIERDLVLIGICAIRDPLRPEVAKAIQDCKRAGVVVRMVTGDNIKTAVSIAKECGILTPDGYALLGKDFSSMPQEELVEILPKLQVLARSSPLDKYRLVSLLMKSGEVVAVTGDGSNDSTALRKANVGLAMGLCGTELAKMASDIVILDDNFSSIVSALKWGRCIYDNIRSFLQFQLTVNLCGMIVTFVGSCIMQKAPFRAIQLLWVSMINGFMGALTLSTRGPTDSLLDRPPYGESGAMISRLMYRNIIVHVLWQVAICLLILFGHVKFFRLDTTDERAMSTFLFNTLVFCQVFNLLNARVTDMKQGFFDGLFSNELFWVFFGLIVVIQVIMVEWGGVVMGTCGLNWKHWLYSVGFGATELVFGAIVRMFPVKDDTEARLIVNREERRQEILNRYSGMSPTAMWNAIENEGQESIVSQKPAKKKEKQPELAGLEEELLAM